MSEEKKVIVFALGSEQYGVEVEAVKTIERMQPMTRVPKCPEFIKGVINLRGVVIPVIDLRSRFGLPETEYTDNTRIIIVSAGDYEVGLIVDSANDVIDLDTDQIDNPPEVVGGIKAKYLRGIARIGDNGLLVLLNLEQVLNKAELLQLSAFHEEE
ncbi:chemotaxis protein CheW [Gordoniibacillus kamchatkensis]|uniref:Chemotaxis protein CheW n=1 Tax=Gordoniibacillus kamchatkensis TaxID=1590651 RepID=A0ABR5AEX9_9BACL|nr:chemotaxis protein CheW [Paenibacillus sp. VKM B-2647]KIL39228.1 chemotaxis protein CheW [Paenibacillus sp. VKM B-2647]